MREKFTAITLEDLRKQGTCFDECDFLSCNWASTDLSNIHFAECTFMDCDLSMAEVNQCTFQDVKFESSKLLGVHFERCKQMLLEFQFINCQLDYACFYGMKVSHLILTNCSLREVDFATAHFAKAQFLNCDFTLAQFDNTFLEFADMTNSYGMTMDLNENYLRGAKVSKESLEGLVETFQLNVV